LATAGDAKVKAIEQNRNICARGTSLLPRYRVN
jgi:hypothetical protein